MTFPTTSGHRVRALAITGMVLVAAAVTARWALARWLPEGMRVVTVAEGLETPWGLAFLPDGRLLVSERPGRLRIVAAGSGPGVTLQGLPPVSPTGEGGLLGVAVDPRHADNGLLWWAYAEPQADGGPPRTAGARGRLAGTRLEDVRVVFRQSPGGGRPQHFGARLLFDGQGHLFIGLGDRDRRDAAQDLAVTLGKVVRLRTDGSVPADNPFVGTPGADPAIWTRGHRNVQGLAFDPQDGSLWATEHGPNGGDEINRLRAGANHGWPVVTHGCEYTTCAPIGEGREKPGMTPPHVVFEGVSRPPTALLRVQGERYPAWRGQWLVGSLWGQALLRLSVDAQGTVTRRDAVRLGAFGRVRDLAQGPDGALYLAVNQPDGRIVRLDPVAPAWLARWWTADTLVP